MSLRNFTEYSLPVIKLRIQRSQCAIHSIERWCKKYVRIFFCIVFVERMKKNAFHFILCYNSDICVPFNEEYSEFGIGNVERACECVSVRAENYLHLPPYEHIFIELKSLNLALRHILLSIQVYFDCYEDKEDDCVDDENDRIWLQVTCRGHIYNSHCVLCASMTWTTWKFYLISQFSHLHSPTKYIFI